MTKVISGYIGKDVVLDVVKKDTDNVIFHGDIEIKGTALINDDKVTVRTNGITGKVHIRIEV